MAWVSIYLGGQHAVWQSGRVLLGAPLDPSAPVIIGDGLRMSWAFAEWPGQLEPSTIALTLYDTADVLTGLTPGTRAQVYVSPDPAADLDASAVWFFWGRVADLNASPHPLGMEYTVNLVDYLADLPNIDVGDQPWPAENRMERLLRIQDLTGVYVSAIESSPPVLRAQDIDRQSLSQVLGDTLASPLDAGGDSDSLGVMVALYDGSSFFTSRLYRTITARVTLYRLLWSAAQQTTRLVDQVVSSDPTTHAVIDGCAVEASGVWRKARDGLINTWTIEGEFDDGTFSVIRRDTASIDAYGPLARSVSTALNFRWLAEVAADWYAGVVAGVSDGWAADSLVWRPALDTTAPEYAVWWPTVAIATISPAVTISPVDASLTPERTPYYTGRVTGADIEFRGGEPFVTMSLLRYDARTIGGDVVTVGDLADAEVGNPTVAQIDPVFTPAHAAATARPGAALLSDDDESRH